MGQNNVTLYRRPNNQLELSINGIVVKSNFTTSVYDSTTQSEINGFIISSEGQNRLDGSYTDASSAVTYITNDSNDDYDGTFQYKINYIDLK